MAVAGAFALDHRQESGRQFLAQLHAPLIKRVDAEDLRLDKHPVLVKRNQPPQRERSQLVIDKGDRGPVARKCLVRRKPLKLCSGPYQNVFK